MVSGSQAIYRISTATLAAALLFAPQLTFGDPYSWEWHAGLGAQEGDRITTDVLGLTATGIQSTEVQSVDTRNTEISGTYYLHAVDDSRGPLAEAAFAQRTSWVGVTFEKSSRDAVDVLSLMLLPSLAPIEFRTSEQLDVTSFGLRGKWTSAPSGWFLQGGAARFQGSGDNELGGFSGNDEVDGWEASIAVGKYIAKTTTLEVGYERRELSRDGEMHSVCDDVFDIFCTPATLTLSVDSESDDVYGAVKHLGQVRGIAFVLSGSASVEWTDKRQVIDILGALLPPDVQEISLDDGDISWDVSAGLFPTQSLGVHVNYGFGHEHTLAARVRWFVVPAVSLEAAYVRARTGEGFYLDGWHFVVSSRF